jgi:hypothetical protein
VHLNGRVYDPLIGRMMSADPMVPDPLNGQAWNRYSYVINNPLAFTDPNGYCFLGMCTWGKGISTFFNRTFGVLFRDVPILGSLLEIAAVLACAPFGPVCMVPAAFASTTFVAGVTSGNLGFALKAGLIAAVTAMANFEVGELTKGLEDMGYFLKVAGRALIGCGSAAASGGSCRSGALSAGATAAAAPAIDGQSPLVATAISATVGGLASVAGGGKFANGAVTGAFGYLFNDFSHLWYGYDAHYSIESFFENKDPNFRGEFQIGLLRVDLVYLDQDAKTIDVYEIKADTFFSGTRSERLRGCPEVHSCLQRLDDFGGNNGPNTTVLLRWEYIQQYHRRSLVYSN